MSLIWKYIRPYLWLSTLAPLCVLLEVWSELAQPELMSQIVDRGILGGERTVIVPLGLRMVAIMLVGLVGGVLSIFAAGRVAYRFGADMRRDLYDRITGLSFADIDRLQSPTLITRLSDDVNRLQQVVQASMRLLFRAPFLFVGAVVMAMMINVRVSVVLVVVMVASFGVVSSVMRSALPLFWDLQKRRDGFVGVVQEVLLGARVVKAYTNEGLEASRFDVVNRGMWDGSVRVGRVMASLMPLVGFALNFGIIVVIYMGAGEVVESRMQIGGIMATINYLAQIHLALMMASHVIMNVTQAKASIGRITEIMNIKTEAEADAHLSRPSLPFTNGNIVFRNVSFSYPDSNRQQLADISFSLERGKTLAILGETGSGKSTLVNLLARFYAPTTGTITIASQDLSDISRTETRQHIAVVMQQPTLFGGTIADNLRMGNADATTADMMRACEMAGIADYVRSLADGLDHKIEEGAVNLSGGQKQRLTIARAVLSRPDILILDDSFSALDTLTERAIRAELSQMSCTKIIVSQRISSIQDAEQIVVLRDGKIVEMGSHESLMARGGHYRQTFKAQTGL